MKLRRSACRPVLAGLVLAGLALATTAPLAIAGEATAPAREEGFVTTPDGVDLHWVAAGSGPSVLFVPGLSLSGEIWQPQLDHFAASHRVVAMDPRSQGRSSQPRDGHYPEARGRDIKTVVDELDLAPTVLVCWSLAVGECRSLGNLQRNRQAATEAFIASMYRTPQTPEYLARMTEISLATPTDALAALMVGGLTADFRPTLAKIDRPTLLAVARSPWLPKYEEMRDLIPGVRFEVFDAGHALFVDQPKRFNQVLGELLAAADGAREDAAPAAAD